MDFATKIAFCVTATSGAVLRHDDKEIDDVGGNCGIQLQQLLHR